MASVPEEAFFVLTYVTNLIQITNWSPLPTGIPYGRLQRVTRCCNNTTCPPEDELSTP